MRAGGERALAAAAISACVRSGVREFCVCAGARNMLLVAELVGRHDVVVRRFFEERSAGFFAVGRAATSGHPVAVVTTSGTAVAELLPALVEAHYRNLPVVALTADRPERFRGSGAPQAIEQGGIFGGYVAGFWDIREAGDLQGVELSQGGHLNVAFDEQPADPPAEVAGHLPVVLIAELPPEMRGAVERFVAALGEVPVWAEATSGLRERCANVFDERILGRIPASQVVRIGGVPSCRLWRDLEGRPDVAVTSVTPTGFSGLGRESKVVRELPDPAGLAVDYTLPASNVEGLLGRFPASEPAAVRRLSATVPEGALVFLGNSLPIREWNAFATTVDRRLRCVANRGANGIDGLVSSWLGASVGEAESWAVVGDLSALYDLAGPWAAGGDGLEDARLRLVVLNNGGGKIFARVPSLRALDPAGREVVENRHSLGFAGWAALWGWQYVRVTGGEAVPAGALSARALVEIVPDAGESERFWEAYDEGI